ncbi:preprotein translocase subunit SecA [Acinetobacter sp. NIPH 2699]|uniref:preprotein translocase subunit SecA n=1 Tax=Acinetobacter sp. NIPH 2699 TaxID=2923433 RepID=UPI001F4A3797|nr:preprotein translocase subunit SecA [Acinetobacter sp. NIPH 2699]MCH7336337.1 preprotein translocase subunit SecA [Acinetobacter sp. NIPH 2699]
MTQQNNKPKSKYHSVDRNSWPFRLFLIYDAFMVFIIVFNLFCLGMNLFLMSSLGEWLFQQIHLLSVLDFYRTHLHPWVITTEAWFIIFLISELIVRWIFAIINKHHARWWWFPFVHFYEILAIIPYLRFLRLFRAGIIAYRLYEMGYQVIPEKIQRTLLFYYRVVMEELSDRVVLTVLDGLKHELKTNNSHQQTIHNLVDHHRQLFVTTLSSLLQESLATALQQQRPAITQKVGIIVNQAIEDTPELTQLLRLIPIVGGRIEQQIQSIGQRLGENISAGLIEPFTAGSPQQPNENFQLIAQKISELNIDNQYLEELVKSVVFESIEAISKQVRVKQWQEMLDENGQLNKKAE